MDREKELESMNTLKELHPLGQSYGIDADHMKKSELIEAIPGHESAPKKKRPPRDEARTKLKAARINAGVTQKALAERAGINQRTLQHYEQGSKKFDLAKIDTILNVCIILGAPLEDIIENPTLLNLISDYKQMFR